MKLKETLDNCGAMLLSLMIGILLLMIVATLMLGLKWAYSKLLPWFQTMAIIAFGTLVLVALPLAIAKRTRVYSVGVLLVVFQIFAATLWMEGFLLTMSIWGGGATVVGMFFGGIGVIPMAMLATLVNGMWRPFVELLALTVLTIAIGMGGTALYDERAEGS